jgi:hypothetical protein
VTGGWDAFTLPEQPVASGVRRPRALFASPATVIGLRAGSVTVAGSARTLSVWLYGDPPAGLVDPSLWSLEGSPRSEVTAGGTVVAAGADPDGNPVPAHVDLPVTATAGALPGRAPYRLHVVPAGLAAIGLEVDPLRAFLPVRLRPECGDAPDCIQVPAPPPPLTAPDYDTLARDYAGLRAMLLERLGALDPGADTSPADVTVTLIELMAHLGDLLSYRQDRVATEAWLGTARRRASVTRHARLVDFPVVPAVSAATVLQVLVARPALLLPDDAAFVVQLGDTATDAAADPDTEPDAANFTIETEAAVTVRASHAEVALYDWTEGDATLTAGATSAVLVRPPAADGVSLADWLPVGSLLGFEVVDPGPPGDQQEWAARVANWPPGTTTAQPVRDPLASHPAQVVRVTHAAEIADPLSPSLPLIRVFWDDPDALTRDVPASVAAGGGSPRVGVARLGLFRAHHGLCVDGPDSIEPFDALTSETPDPSLTEVRDYWLTRGRPAGLSCAPGGRPWQLQTTVRLPSGVTVEAGRVTSLLRAPAGGFSVVVDHDDDDPPRLRFATGAVGLVPPAGSVVTARYQVGTGAAGLIPSNSLTRLVRTSGSATQPCTWLDAAPGVTARNITPGAGGTPGTPLDTVRRDAPQAYAAESRRAVLVSDLPSFALVVPGVARAAARRDWSGSWPVGVVSVESRTDRDDPTLDAAVEQVMDAVRMAGTEVVVVPATPIGLLLALTVCLTPGTDASVARLAILAALRPGSPRAVFAPASHPLGTSVYVSTVVAAVAAVRGVDAVRVTEARRLSEPAGTLHQVLPMGPAEIALCDDDAGAPDRGRIDLTLEGGR